MAHKITVKISKKPKQLYTTNQKMYKKLKELRAYARALVYVADTMNIIFAKFAWTIINIEFLQCILKALRDLAFLTLSGINSKIFGPNHRKDSSPNELVLDFCGQ